MEELYSGYGWVRHFSWVLSGTSEDAKVHFDLDCPDALLPFVGAIIDLQLSEQDSRGDHPVLFNDNFAEKLSAILRKKVMSVETLSKLSGITSEDILGLAHGSINSVTSTRHAVTLTAIVNNLIE